MTAPSYRLDTVAVHLVERLEGARPTWADRPDEAGEAFRRIADEELDRIVAEHDELVGEPGVGERLRREVHETFLPRYTRLAVDHNALELAGYKAWRQGDPVARVASTVAAVLLALLFVRLVHHPVALVAFGAVVLVPFISELRRWYYRREYRGLLQQVVDDMARIQDRLDAYPTADALADRGAAPARQPEAAPPRPQPRKTPESHR